MSDNPKFSEIIIPNETKHQLYVDGVQPAVSEAGKLVGRIPRAINAALSGLDQWILKKEYNVSMTKKSLESKLESIEPDKIVPPEPYVAVPALQAIAYTINSNELHDLYANLLSKAMVSYTKDNVHPSFVEIIKQMSPNDALVIKKITESDGIIPAATLSIAMKIKGVHLVNQSHPETYYLDVIFDLHIDNMTDEQIRISMDNLNRLGLITKQDNSLHGENVYNFVKNSQLYKETNNEFESLKAENKDPDFIRTTCFCFTISPLGSLFADICINGFDKT